ncbi:Mitochondrial import inner membrane translocase subunit PAM16 like 2 [Vitis vinifera]|uniref:Mitochondrial import inner membrane translocase subunit PAM16 like 2 n=1 Tax=Vitis vinifera TaxID=29760 RepID=A0A438K9E4_VITVI|nr:Mitochondrial import inner membrane translocase subunit PAM16 like 2 [Vitis vinifera]
MTEEKMEALVAISLIWRMKYVWIEESPNTASDFSVAPPEKGRPPQIAVWYHQKGRRTLPKARAGIGVGKKWSELRRKDCLEGRRRQKSPKEVRPGLGWENQGGGKADRRQAKLEEEARRRKSSHAPPRAGARSFWYGRCRKNRSPENSPENFAGKFAGKFRRKICQRRKIHLVRWEVTCKDMRHGGLGLRYLKDFNHALLGKWLWRFPIERESLWRRVIVGKFGEVQGGWTTREVRESYGTGLWKDIRKGWEEFFLRTRIHIGNGRRTRFWWDMWVGDSKLKDLFPLLFRIAANNSAIVADLWGRQEGGGGGWEVHFRRPFQDWELEEVNRFLGYISAVRVQEGEDFLVWKLREKERLRCNLCKENEETANHILIHCGHGEEKECSLENGAYLSVLVYLGRAKSKNLPRGRDDKHELEETFSSAAKILANLVVIGSGILARALVQAYRQALANASKSGVAQETVQNIRRGSKIMAELEARQILGVTEHSSWEEILQKYDNLFEQNAKNGSFYLQSKVHRAKECLESVY